MCDKLKVHWIFVQRRKSVVDFQASQEVILSARTNNRKGGVELILWGSRQQRILAASLLSQERRGEGRSPLDLHLLCMVPDALRADALCRCPSCTPTKRALTVPLERMCFLNRRCSVPRRKRSTLSI